MVSEDDDKEEENPFTPSLQTLPPQSLHILEGPNDLPTSDQHRNEARTYQFVHFEAPSVDPPSPSLPSLITIIIIALSSSIVHFTAINSMRQS